MDCRPTTPEETEAHRQRGDNINYEVPYEVLASGGVGGRRFRPAAHCYEPPAAHCYEPRNAGAPGFG